MSSGLDGFRAIIPAGGAGTRLWPLSRKGAPKFLHDFTGSGRSLIQGTVDRLAPLTGPDGIVIVTGVAHAAAVQEQLPTLGQANLIAELSPRDSMAAIGLAAAILAQREGDVVVGSFAADHVIANRPAFEAAVATAVRAARAGYVATIGIAPTRPATGFGYIHLGPPTEQVPGARAVDCFAEKPDAATAQQYLEAGDYRWNAGMFVVRAEVLLGHLAQTKPDLAAGLRQIAQAWDTSRRDQVLQAIWPTLERIAIDYAIAEPVSRQGGMAVVEGEFDWDDVGDWRSLGDLIDPAADGVRRLGQVGRPVVVDSPGTLIASTTGRMVAVAGIPDLVVVDTPDALLITTRQAAQGVRDIVTVLAADDRDDLL